VPHATTMSPGKIPFCEDYPRRPTFRMHNCLLKSDTGAEDLKLLQQVNIATNGACMVEASAPEPLSLLWIFVALSGLATGSSVLEGLAQKAGFDQHPKVLHAAYRELAVLGKTPPTHPRSTPSFRTPRLTSPCMHACRQGSWALPCSGPVA